MSHEGYKPSMMLYKEEVRKAIEETKKEKPFGVDYSTYREYNKGWQDALESLKEYLDLGER